MGESQIYENLHATVNRELIYLEHNQQMEDKMIQDKDKILRTQQIVNEYLEYIKNCRMIYSKILELQIAQQLCVTMIEFINLSLKSEIILTTKMFERYLLESLITIKILNREKYHIYRMNYAIIKNKNSNLCTTITLLKKEIEKLRKYSNIENKELLEIQNKYFESEISTNILAEEIQNIEKKYDKQFRSELPKYCYGFEHNGYSFQAHLLETQVLPKYTAELNESKKELDEIETEYYKNNEIREYFDIKQKTQVFKKLQDNRSWKQKAEAAGLSDAYENFYSSSSELIHHTTMSLLSKLGFQENEKTESLNTMDMIISNILDELKVLVSKTIPDRNIFFIEKE